MTEHHDAVGGFRDFVSKLVAGNPWILLWFNVVGTAVVGLGFALLGFALPDPSDYLIVLVSATLGLMVALGTTLVSEVRRNIRTIESLTSASAVGQTEIRGSIAVARREHTDILEQLKAITGTSESVRLALWRYLDRVAAKQIPKNDVPEIWRELLWSVAHSYEATNYISFGAIYSQPWSEAAMAIQIAKAKAQNSASGRRTQIRKLFIFDDVTEIDEDVRHEIDRQFNGQIACRVVFVNDIVTYELEPALQTTVARIEAIVRRELHLPPEQVPLRNLLDFGIFDDDCVLLWKLDEERQADGGAILLGRENIDAFRGFFGQMYNVGKDWSRVRTPT